MQRSRPNAAARLALVACFVLGPISASAQDLTNLSSALDSLLSVPISTASKYAQLSREAAASVTVITSEEIRRQGFRTVAEALQSVPGFFLTYNRSYVSLGVRGFTSLSGDNTQVLILLDGHSLNENFLDGARIGTGLGIDMWTIDRIEVVRGPSSALYGSNAMLAVVNVITRSGRSVNGIQIGAEIGSFLLRGGSILAGHELASGLSYNLSASLSRSDGNDVYFPEWDTPLTNYGVSTGSDWSESTAFLGSIRYGYWRLAGLFSDRDKGQPTAPLGSDFGNPESHSSDRRFFGEVSYDRAYSPTSSVTARAYYDGADFEVLYPFAQTGDIVGGTSGRWAGAEMQWRWDAAVGRRVTVGGEFRNNHRVHVGGGNPVLGPVTGDFPSTIASGFAQADFQLHEDLQITLGGRVDHYSSVGTAFSPRGALVYHPRTGSTLKALFGQAFRAPNQPELNVDAPPLLRRNPDIGPERVRTVELVWEQRVSDQIHATFAAYDYTVTDLIGASQDPMDGALVFQNVGDVERRGIELGVDARPLDEISLRASYTYVHPNESVGEGSAPRHSLRAALGGSLADLVDVGVNMTLDGARRLADSGQTIDSYLLTNVTLSTSSLGQVRMSVTAANVFDVAYSHPAGPEFFQSAHPQDGRTVRLRVDLWF